MEQKIAKALLEIGAVFLRPDEPFTWASGIKSPIYCDNRLILTAPDVRDEVENALASIMSLPMGYVRGGSKDHGRQNRIEGRLQAGQKVVVVEDLISTAGSSIEAVEALREAGADVLGIASIFTYGMQCGVDNLAKAGVKNVSLSNFDVLIQAAASCGYIKDSDVERLLRFRNNPNDESWAVH